ncbi:FAD binding domain-containing protein [bacterium]|nr:FAD binding domain-containing protein [bacterium]
MMTLPKFEYLAPKNISEAAELLEKYGEEAKLIAGGTDLLVSMKQKLFTPNYLIGLDGIAELQTVHFTENEGLTLGSCVTLAEITKNKMILEKFPLLALAASKVATVTLRNKGTIGGNVLLDTRCYYYNQSFFWRQSLGFCMKKDGTFCHVAPGSPTCRAIVSTDVVPVLVALETKITFFSAKNGKRTVDLKDFYINDGILRNRIQPDEVLVSLNIPTSPKGFKGTYKKLRRRETIDYPMLGVAVSFVEDKNLIKNVKIILTAIHSSPFEVVEAQQLLENQKPTQEIINEAAEICYKLAKPLDLTNAPPLYRKKMVRVLVRRALEELANC